MDKDVADFVLVLLHSGTNAHLMHLAAEGPDSYAKHQALGEYYKEIIETTDQFAEAYQGKYGRIKGYGEDYHVATDAMQYMTAMKDFVGEARELLPQDSELQNIVDEIADLINTTLYKLTLS